ncbi:MULTISPECIES: transposase [Petrotoga]|uniref:DDE family transposase n=1 Tax=Petrotoga sibirica TaxID=156202 RepID=A0A4R8EXR2_9BACT|nr:MULTISPECIES: transposase [Petrotoga]TDX17502.1 DDE family transposase [Petrotoga sibirica]
MIDWSVVPDFNNKIGRTGYSRRVLLKAIFVQKVEGFTVRELIHFLKSNPSFAKCIGFDPIINYVPSEATFSSFKKEFDPSYLDKVIVFTVIKGIKEGINVPIFTVVSPASAYDKNYAFVLLEKVVKCLDLSGFNFLADAAYDSSDLYDYVHLKTGSIAFILLHSSSKKGLVGECGKKLVKHSHYLESKRNIYRTKFVCDDPSNCPLGKPNCYSYRNYSKYDFRRFLNRDSSFFKEIYKKRTLIESIFSRLESNNGTTSLKYTNAVQLECNLSNLFLIASALLAHKMGRDDLLSSPKTLMYETAS